jgi:hypothetical protein
LNLYGFANGDPVTYDDPFGLCAPWCTALAGGALGGGGRMLFNHITDRPLWQGVGASAAAGAAAGALLGVGGSALLARGGAAAAEIGAGAGVGGAAFRHGTRVKEFVQTSAGNLEVSFKVAIDGGKLHLQNFSVFGADSERLKLGAGEMLKLTRGLMDAAKSQGFDQITITGNRVGGANPGHMFEVTRGLK